MELLNKAKKLSKFFLYTKLYIYSNYWIIIFVKSMMTYLTFSRSKFKKKGKLFILLDPWGKIQSAATTQSADPSSSSPGVIILLPSVELFAAHKALCQVRLCLASYEVEPGSCHLQQHTDTSTKFVLCNTKIQCYYHIYEA